jgi:hypothetical protein
MERRHFLKIAFGFAAGATALAATAKAAPLPPASPQLLPPHGEDVEPAVISQDEVDHLTPQEVRWGRHWHRRGHWGRRRHWGFRRRHWGWRRRHWGWHRHRWHRRHWGWHRHWRRHRW